jgi:hypothetical protein
MEIATFRTGDQVVHRRTARSGTVAQTASNWALVEWNDGGRTWQELDEIVLAIYVAVGEVVHRPGYGAVIVLGADAGGVLMEDATGRQHYLPSHYRLTRLPDWLRPMLLAPTARRAPVLPYTQG